MRVTDKFVFFWGGIFSQWNIDTDNDGYQFIDNEGIKYNCAEQYMMYKKAELFGDVEIQQQILNTQNPSLQRELGRKVKNFDQKTWNENCQRIVYEANLFKFTQNETLKEVLLQYYDKEFVEASPIDKIWGIGMAYTNDLILDKKNWKGTNFLGIAINKVVNELHITELFSKLDLTKKYETIDTTHENFLFTKKEFEILKNGFIPKQMEDRWFIFFAENKLHFIREWDKTPFLYIVSFKKINKNFQTKFQLYQIDISTHLLKTKNTTPAYETRLCLYLILRILLKADVDYPINPNYEDEEQAVMEAWSTVGEMAFNSDKESTIKIY